MLVSPGAVHKCQQLQQPDTRGGKHFFFPAPGSDFGLFLSTGSEKSLRSEVAG